MPAFAVTCFQMPFSGHLVLVFLITTCYDKLAGEKSARSDLIRLIYVSFKITPDLREKFMFRHQGMTPNQKGTVSTIFRLPVTSSNVHIDSCLLQVLPCPGLFPDIFFSLVSNPNPAPAAEFSSFPHEACCLSALSPHPATSAKSSVLRRSAEGASSPN